MEIKYFKRKTTVFLCENILETFLQYLQEFKEILLKEVQSTGQEVNSRLKNADTLKNLVKFNFCKFVVPTCLYPNNSWR